MTDKYPGYNVDPKVRKVIDRCTSIGLTDLYKPYSNTRALFKFSTLEKDLCIPSKLTKDRWKRAKVGLHGVMRFKSAAHGQGPSVAKPKITLKAKVKAKAKPEPTAASPKI